MHYLHRISGRPITAKNGKSGRGIGSLGFFVFLLYIRSFKAKFIAEGCSYGYIEEGDFKEGKKAEKGFGLCCRVRVPPPRHWHGVC